ADGGAAAAANPNPTPPSLALQEQERRAQYQQMADRLGETLAQRLVSQVERGQWKMQMRMQPSGLGRIDVELDMRAEGLHAMFTADNSVTRDLINQGANRLRDNLAQAGMAVANFWVGGDASSKSGGNPTHGQAFQEAIVAQDRSVAAVKPAATALPTEPFANRSDATGLDVLA
ncbi:MAG: flagellar hook-length control protein FliK, partial [Rhodoferax sp.]